MIFRVKYIQKKYENTSQTAWLSRLTFKTLLNQICSRQLSKIDIVIFSEKIRKIRQHLM